MGCENIRKDMHVFQSSIKKLSTGISKASAIWKDEKYAELSSSITELANQSKDVMVTADRCCSSIEKFEKIASEKY